MNCIYRKEDGAFCRAKSEKSSEYCFFHNPENTEKRKLAQSKGGKANLLAVKTPLDPICLSTAEDVLDLLKDTINRVRSGEFDVKTGNCLGLLSSYSLKAIELVNFSKRLKVVESAILSSKNKLNY